MDLTLCRKWLLGSLVFLAILSLFYFLPSVPNPFYRASSIDDRLRSLLKKREISIVEPGRHFGPNKAELGKKLFWDKILGANRKTACATCHSPLYATTDRRSLALNESSDNSSTFLTRNTIGLFNRTAEEPRSMMWDNAVRMSEGGRPVTPISEYFSEGEVGIPSQQILWHLADPRIMGEQSLRSSENPARSGESFSSEADLRNYWNKLLDRVKEKKEYRLLFDRAYPGFSQEALEPRHMAQAITAYQVEYFKLLNSPWDQYVAGNNDAISRKEKQGGVLFWGRANCHSCHSGELMSDFRTYNIGVPQIGSGYEAFDGFDPGKYRWTGNSADSFAFRTPPLRNVTLTGPWMHNGVFKSLERVIEHHVNPEESLSNFRGGNLVYDLRVPLVELPVFSEELSAFDRAPELDFLRNTLKNKPSDQKKILLTMDNTIQRIPQLDTEEISLLLNYLRSLTSPSLRSNKGDVPKLIMDSIPDTVPGKPQAPY